MLIKKFYMIIIIHHCIQFLNSCKFLTRMVKRVIFNFCLMTMMIMC